jgi:phosphoesterase RecJ-like protein
MVSTVFEFLKKYSSFIITTHDTADADGLGAELVFSLIVRSLGKQIRIINSSPVPENFRFMDPGNEVECWANAKDTISRNDAMVILDTADEYNIGDLKEIIPNVPEVFVIDHHEPKQFCTFKGYIDNSSSSTCEMVLELAQEAGLTLPPVYAQAAYAGLVYDTGFFAYSTTTIRTFRAALALVEAGVNPYEVYRHLNENSTTAAVILLKNVFSTLETHNRGRVAVQVLRKADLEKCGARYEDAENFINIPMRSSEIEVSVLIKENREEQVRCSLRSKGRVNVSKIAQTMGGGGHVSAAGFKSSLSVEETLAVTLEKISEALESI